MNIEAFRKITVISVTGLPNAQGAALALAHSQAMLPGSRALLCSPRAPQDLPPSIVHCPIAPLNYHEYSWFMMFVLWRLIETEFALVVQDDGWVLSADNWDDAYFDYDYVGAPVHLARIDSAQGMRWVRGFEWCAELGLPDRRIWPVLNGGFSLRSQRFMRALLDHPQIKVEIPPPDLVGGHPLQMHWYHDALNEDVQLTAVLRPALEAVGLRFAPLEVAASFAMEHAGSAHRGRDVMKLFGHHSRYRRLVSLTPLTVRYKISRAQVQQIFGETEMCIMLQRRGYRIEFPEDMPHPGAAVPRKVYDCFTYNGETDILVARLHELAQVVNWFVIVEADRRHSGEPKPLRFDASDPRIAAFLPRIRYVLVHDLPTGGLDEVVMGDWLSDTPQSGYWIREKFQRNQIMRGLHDAAPHDLVMISDADEIPRAAVVHAMHADQVHDVFGLQMALYYLYANYRNVQGPEANTVWSVAATYARLLQSTPDRMRIQIRGGQQPAWILGNAGWHLSYLGMDEAAVRQKIRASAHQEYATQEVLEAIDIPALIASGHDLYGRPGYVWCVVGREEAPAWMASRPEFDRVFITPRKSEDDVNASTAHAEAHQGSGKRQPA